MGRKVEKKVTWRPESDEMHARFVVATAANDTTASREYRKLERQYVAAYERDLAFKAALAGQLPGVIPVDAMIAALESVQKH